MTSGERWAVAELGELRVGGFRPHGWQRFVSASFQRAAATRQARPELARQARIWSAVGLCAGIAVCARSPFPGPRPLRFALWWLASCAMLDWHLGMVEGPHGEHRERLSTADALTLTRISLVPFLAAQSDPERASARTFIVLLVLAGASDALDGVLARRAGPTRLGRDLDPIADALTSAAAARAARRAEWLPAGAARLSIARSALPLAAVAARYFRTGQRPATDAFRATRPLSPVMLGGLVAAPLSARTGVALTSAASIGSLALMAQPIDRLISVARDRSFDAAQAALAPLRSPSAVLARRAVRKPSPSPVA
jgi:phosphatidylglycerophosphate synthase